MAGITQQISNYVLGMSEQPDELKLPGQVVDLKNGIPDVTRGLTKRPGSKLISTITPNSGTLSWFHYYKDETDQFIGNVKTDGVIQMWRTSDGASIPIDYAAVSGTNLCTYLTGWTTKQEIQAITINESTFITNRTKQVAMKTGTSDKSPARVHEACIELKTLSPGKQYALDIFVPTDTTTQTYTRATSIVVDEDVTTSGIADDGTCEGQGRETVIATGVSLGGGSRTGNNMRYEMDTRCVPVVDPDNLGSSSSGAEYNDSYQPYATLQFGGENWQTNDQHTYTSQKGVTTTVTVKSHVTITCRAGLARVRPAATSSRVDEAVTADGILGGMKTALDAISNTGITATIVGNCLHLSRASAFNVTAPDKNIMSIVTSEANNVADLANSGRHGHVVKIVNSADEDDDYYLKFKVDNQAVGSNETLASARFGAGHWTETCAPNLNITLDKDTMPVQLRRVDPGTYSINGGPSQSYPNGVFEVVNPSWNDRLVGDDNTNPEPTFVGNKIQKLLFFRNRFVALSDNNVILSRTNEFYNWWSKTAMTVGDSDPIDLKTSSTFPTKLFDGIEVNTGLLLFSSNQQFMLTTDSDTLSPTTAKVNYLSSFNYNHNTKPFSLGATAGFLNNTGSNARFYEMQQVRREGEPILAEISKIISKKFPVDIDLASSSNENNIVFFSAPGKSEIWGYKYYNNGERTVQTAWFRWELPGAITYQAVMDDVYYTIVKTGSNYNLETYDIKEQNSTTLIGTDPDDYFVNLDCHKEIAAGSLSYSATTKKTSVATPAGFIHTGKQLAVFVNKNNTAGSADNIGRFALASVNGSNIEWEGDWTDGPLLLGYVYDWLVELPTIYRSQMSSEGKIKSDTQASLIVQRLHFRFGAVGYISTTLKRKGREDYTDTYESLDWSDYSASKLGIDDEHVHTIPAYERNSNLTVQLKSSHPSPATLHSMNWEGDYSTRYYQRV